MLIKLHSGFAENKADGARASVPLMQNPLEGS